MSASEQILVRLRYSKARGKCLKFRCTVFCIALCGAIVLCLSPVIAGDKLTFAIALVSLVLPALVAIGDIDESGILSPTALFAGSFAAYNGVLLIRFAIPDVQHDLLYPVSFVPTDFFTAGILSALASISIALVWLFWKPGCGENAPRFQTTGWMLVGVTFYFVGLGFYVLQYAQVGGYWAALSTSRVDRFDMLTETISLPYLPFVLIGIVTIIISSIHERRSKVWIFLPAAFWCIAVLLQGDRRLVLQAILAATSAWALTKRKQLKLRLRHVALAIAAYMIFAAIGELRIVVPVILSTGASINNTLTSASSDVFLESLKPEKSELSGPFLSVLFNISRPGKLALGTTYIETLGAVLPRALYPGKKPLSPSSELVKRVNAGIGAAAGYGYSPIAEAFLNFGYVGVVVICGCWTAVCVKLNELKHRGWYVVLVSVLLSETINVNRIDFRTIYLESFFCLLGIALATACVRLVLMLGGAQPLRRVSA